MMNLSGLSWPSVIYCLRFLKTSNGSALKCVTSPNTEIGWSAFTDKRSPDRLPCGKLRRDIVRGLSGTRNLFSPLLRRTVSPGTTMLRKEHFGTWQSSGRSQVRSARKASSSTSVCLVSHRPVVSAKIIPRLPLVEIYRHRRIQRTEQNASGLGCQLLGNRVTHIRG